MAFAQNSHNIQNVTLTRNGEYMTVRMDVDPSNEDVRSNEALLLTPCLTNAENGSSVKLNAIGLYGRNRYYHYLRSNGEGMLSGLGEMSYKAKDVDGIISYESSIPFEEWMNNSTLILDEKVYGCCRRVLSENEDQIGRYKNLAFVPDFLYVQPKATGAKTRTLSGSAFINFPVNRWDILPERKDNASELGKITSSIDSVKNDTDIKVTRLSIKGYASPEGSYKNNERLAKNRTESLKAYVSKLYDFDKDFIQTDSEPEDWAGLRELVVNSGLQHKTEILDLIDKDMDADKKDQTIKSKYPSEYATILNEYYPSLRHSDYEIEYEIREFSDPDEIRRLVRTAPQKLSLEEFYLAANAVEEGSEEFQEIFDTAVRMYPNDETANLNAANAAMQRGDMVTAEKYLAKSGQTGEAVYAKALYAAKNKDYAKALQLFQDAQNKGVGKAAGAIQSIKEIME